MLTQRWHNAERKDSMGIKILRIRTNRTRSINAVIVYRKMNQYQNQPELLLEYLLNDTSLPPLTLPLATTEPTPSK